MAWNAIAIKVSQVFYIFVTKFSAHFLVTQKRRVANDDIHRRPLRLIDFGSLGDFRSLVSKDCIYVLYRHGWIENRFFWQAISVIPQPLNVSDLDRHLRQFVSVFVDLDAMHL